MNRRNVLALTVITAFGLATGGALAQQTDIDAIKAVSNAYYPALAALDDGGLMEKVWAHTPYTTFVGPRSTSFLVGWDAIKKNYAESGKLLSERNISLSEGRIHVSGNLAWEVGRETGQSTRKDGVTSKSDNLASRVYEKLDGRWLMVSHHA